LNIYNIILGETETSQYVTYLYLQKTAPQNSSFEAPSHLMNFILP